MNWFKRLFNKNKTDNQCDIPVVVSSVTTDKCLCELNAKEELVSGWCSKHHTDWL